MNFPSPFEGEGFSRDLAREAKPSMRKSHGEKGEG